MHRSMLRLAAVAAGVIIAVPCLAQFQEPTKEELQMTAEPKAPGAKSVYLYVEDQQDDSKSARVFYDRVKILTEKGKEFMINAYEAVDEVQALYETIIGTEALNTLKTILKQLTAGLKLD